MSSISSGVDLTVKYQRLTAEFVKVRNQISVLKSALLEEQSKNAEQRRELNLQKTQVNKLESERDSLLFRNDQLVKRVESLQESIEAQQATFGMAKGKKKHKEANLRLVAESSRMHQQSLGGTSLSNPLSVMEEELERKITENGELHSKLFDMERHFAEVTNEYLHRIDGLERENVALKRTNSDLLASKTIGSDENQKDRLRPIEINGLAKLSLVQKTTSTSEIEAINDPCKTFLDGPNSQTCSRLADSRFDFDEKPSNSSLDPSEQTEKASEDGEWKLLEEHHAEHIQKVTKSLQYATGRATYYKQECEELIRKSLFDQEEIDTLRTQIAELEDKYDSLNDTLETTQTNYEAQIRELYEHMAGQDAKIIDQVERRKLIRDDANQPKGGGSTENGDGQSKSDKQARNWFSTSSASK